MGAAEARVRRALGRERRKDRARLEQRALLTWCDITFLHARERRRAKVDPREKGARSFCPPSGCSFVFSVLLSAWRVTKCWDFFLWV